MANESCCSIKKITICFPSEFALGKTRDLRLRFKAENLGRYLRYVGSSFIVFEDSQMFVDSENIAHGIFHCLSCLIERGILSKDLSPSHIGIREVILIYDLPYPALIFCNLKGFRKLSDTTYMSMDYRANKRQNRERGGSKGIQQSFVTVVNNNEGVSLQLTFSGKYAQNLEMRHLERDTNTFIKSMNRLASVYLTQATNPEYLKISKGYLPYILPNHRLFIELLNNANWFADFKRCYATKKFLGGVL